MVWMCTGELILRIKGFSNMKSYFSAASYDTDENKRRLWRDRIFLNSRWYFVFGYLKEIFLSRKLALKNLYDRTTWIDSSYRIFQHIENCGGRFHLRGLENISSAKGPVVFISNHMSTLETFVFPCIIAPLMPVTFIVKESLVKSRIFGPVMRSRNPIVVKRVNPREDFQTVITEGKKLLSAGVSIVVFPQSTRSDKFIPEEFNSLGVKLAKAAGVEIIPVAIKTDFWGNGWKKLKDIGPVNRHKPIYITFGKPMPVVGTGKEEHKSIVEFISQHLQQWSNQG